MQTLKNVPEKLQVQQEKKKLLGLCNLSRFLSVDRLRKQFQNTDCQTVQQMALTHMYMQDKLIDVFMEFKFNKLEAVNFCTNQIGLAGIRKFVTNDWPALKKMYLSNNNVGDEGLKVLLKKTWINIERLDLCQNQISSKGLECLPAIEPNSLIHLKSLELSNKGIQYLVKSNFPQLEHLELNNCNLTDSSIKHLVKGHWINLKNLWVVNRDGITLQSLTVLEGNNWKLTMLGANFKFQLCIHYFSAVLKIIVHPPVFIVNPKYVIKAKIELLIKAHVQTVKMLFV